MRRLALVPVGALAMVTALLAGCTGGSPDRGSGSAAAVPSPASASSSGRPSSSTGRPSSSQPASSSAGTVPCDQAIDTHAQSGSLHVVLGVVALPASPGYPALQTALTGQSGPLRLFAKTGLVIRPGTTLRLVIPAPFDRHARMGWGSPGRAASQIDADRCPNPGSGWLAFAGGYWVDRPACLPILVSSNGQEETVHVGLGTACPGQRPPQPPTES